MKVPYKFGGQKGGLEEAIEKWLHETASSKASRKSERSMR